MGTHGENAKEGLDSRSHAAKRTKVFGGKMDGINCSYSSTYFYPHLALKCRYEPRKLLVNFVPSR